MQRYADIMNHFGLRSQMKKLNEEVYEFLEAVNNYEALIFENECYDNVYTAEELDIFRDHLVEEMYRLEILRRHDILIVHLEFLTGVLISHSISATADLIACTTVGTRIHLMQAHIALATDSHAQCSVAEHLDADRLAVRAGDILLTNLVGDALHLIHIELTRKHHHIGKLRIKSHSIGICHIHLSRNVHLLVDLTSVKDSRHIGRNDSRYTRLLSAINDIVQELHIIVIHHSIDRQITLHAMLITLLDNLIHVVHSEIST